MVSPVSVLWSVPLPPLGGRPRESALEWEFPSGARVRFAHMEHPKNRLDWQGAEIALICFDELTTFTERQFFFMLSRNRSTCGVRPYIRATTNPDADSWVASLVSWWIDADTGYPLGGREGALRWFVRRGDELVWFDTRGAARRHLDRAGEPATEPKSLTFIPARVFDNKILLERDPGYVANLKALPYVEREQLLGGNWKVRRAAGMIFKRSWFTIVDAAPARPERAVRYWDKAATEGGGARTAGVVMTLGGGAYYVCDVVKGQWSALKREAIIRATAEADGKDVDVWIEQEPGSGGKESAEATIRALAGFNVRADRVTGDKVLRAGPYAAQLEAGNVRLVAGRWNKDFIDEHDAFEPAARFKDQVDAAAAAFNKLSETRLAGVWGR